MSDDEPKGNCPFCGAVVSENLLLFGGSCPSCFGKIPGEEVATHPGFAEMAKLEKASDDQARRRTLLPFVFAAGGLTALGLLAVGFVIWNQDPVVEPLNFDELDPLEYEVVAAAPDPEPEAPKPGPKPVRPKSNPGGTAEPTPAPTPDPQVAVAPAPRKPGGLNFGDPGVQVQRQGVELKEPDQIAQMVRKVMNANASSLSDCYNQALERNPQLEGRWRAMFTVGKGGYAKDISFTGRTAKDPEMEQCLARTVARWPFSKIAVDQPVQKTWKFAKN